MKLRGYGTAKVAIPVKARGWREFGEKARESMFGNRTRALAFLAMCAGEGLIDLDALFRLSAAAPEKHQPEQPWAPERVRLARRLSDRLWREVTGGKK